MKPTKGTVLGGWRLVDRLGAGGMGEVWRAVGREGFVAIKLLRAKHGDLAAVRRFEREAHAQQQIDHPNVVKAIDFGQAEDGSFYLAMEMLEGESLDDRVTREGPLPPSEVVRIGRAAAAGLQAAHAAGLIHRDVKPGNLFLCADGVVKVIDFGLALYGPLGDLPTVQTRLTQTGIVLGTPSYMAPEQASGERTEDLRIDIWAVGAVSYHALAGRPPFWAGGNAIAELFRIVTEPLDALPDTVPSALQDVIVHALQKAPEDRFQSMAEFAAALAASAPTASTGPGPTREPSQRVVVRGPSDSDGVHAALDEEVRLVAAVLAEGIRGTAGLSGFLAEVRSRGGTASGVRGRRAVGVFGGAAWTGDEAERAVRAAIASRSFARCIGVGTGKAVYRPGKGGSVTGAALGAAAGAIEALEPSSAEAAVTQPIDVGIGADVDTEAHAGGSSDPADTDEVVVGSPAARLAEVGVCAETLRRVRGAFRFDGVRVVGERSGRRPLGVREVGARGVDLVGRVAELERLEELVLRATDEKQAQAALLVGPPGIGKSRLRHELTRWFEARAEPHQYLEARGEAGRVVSLHATVRGMLRARASLPEGTSVADSRERIEELVASAGLLGEKAWGTVDFLGELLGIPFPENQHLRTARAEPRVMADRIRLAIGDLFAGWTAAGPVLLALEDAQWADSASLELVDFLLTRLTDAPLVLVATARPEFLTEQPHALPQAERIFLKELSQRDTSVIVEQILGRPIPVVIERASGNPYFAEELSYAVREGAALEQLPLTVEGAVQARLDKLALGEKDLLKRAAVIGRRFWSETLEAQGEPDAGRVLATLRRRELVLPRVSSSLAGCDEWVFRQGVVREVCLGMLTPRQRQRLHRCTARWLAERSDASPAEVADQFREAGDSQSAREWWLRAAYAAHRHGHSDEVLLFSDRALQWGPPLPPQEEHDLRLRRAEALFWLGRFEEEEEERYALESIEEAAGGTIDPTARAEARRRRALTLVNLGREAEAVRAAFDAFAVADGAQNPTTTSRCLGTVAAVLASSGRLEEALDAAQEAMDLAEQSGDRLTKAHAAHDRALVSSFGGHNAAALDGFKVARTWFHDLGDMRQTVTAATNIGAALQNLGDYEAARAVLGETLENARGLAMRHIESAVLCNLGMALARLGDADAGIAAEDAAVDRAQEAGLKRHAGVALAYRASIRRECGQLAKALADVDSALVELRDTEGAAELLCRAIRASILVDLGRSLEAVTDCEEALALRETAGGMEEFEADLFLAYFDALNALGRTDEAGSALVRAWSGLQRKLEKIDDPHLHETFVRDIPAHARLCDLVSQAPTQIDD